MWSNWLLTTSSPPLSIGLTVQSDDNATSTFPNNAVGLNTFYNSGTDSHYYSARLYSNWSDRFSTEFRYSRSEVQDIQDPVGGVGPLGLRPGVVEPLLVLVERLLGGVEPVAAVGRLLAGVSLFVAGFTLVFVLGTAVVGAASSFLLQHADLLVRILGVVLNRLRTADDDAGYEFGYGDGEAP